MAWFCSGGEGCVLGDDKFGFGGLLTDCTNKPVHAAVASSSKPRVSRPLCETGSLIPCHLRDDGRESCSLSDRYEIDEQPIGSGTYGEVLGATHRKTRARRAVKAVDKESFAKFSQTKRDFLWRELEILRIMDHPNIVRLYEAFEDERFIYLVLELCSGGDLLARVAAPVVRMSEQEAAMLFVQMLSAIQHLHIHSIVHRDVKPENFLFTCSEPARHPLPPKTAPLKLIDFGLSRQLEAGASGRMTPRIGTREYMSPESDNGSISAESGDRSDMWSMGVVLHTMLTGHFPNKSLATKAPHDYFAAAFWNRFSPAAKDLMMNLLHFRPQHRISSTQAMKHPWLLVAPNVQLYSTALNFPDAIRAFASLQGLRRLVLVAAAREMDDRDVCIIRSLFQRLQNQCEGNISRAALLEAQNDEGIVGDIAGELWRAFDAVDVNNSRTIDWTELVAASLCASNDRLSRGGMDNDSNFEGALDRHTDQTMDSDTCFRAFDLLSNGNGVVVCEAPGLDSAGRSTTTSRRWVLT